MRSGGELLVSITSFDWRPLRSGVFLFTALVIVGVLVCTLWPMPYHRRLPAASFLDGYRYLSWRLSNPRDMLNNLLLFIPVGASLWASTALVVRRGLALPIAATLGALLSVAIEWTQVFIPGRFPGVSDVCMNSIGCLAGAMGAMVVVAMARLALLRVVGQELVSGWRLVARKN
ncbi:MAG: hypothetical protein HBSAPP02_22460 [Phycisphaerae bacterium]|nr:MAG: hypothetical protein HBSAPP02_22460 [Phycisphaerae bacterium]